MATISSSFKQAAVEAGALIVSEITDSPEVVAPKTPAATALMDNDAKIRDAINRIMDAGDGKAFGVNGKPHIRAIEKIIQIDITPQERDTVWEHMLDGE
jgi:hypothetical protein